MAAPMLHEELTGAPPSAETDRWLDDGARSPSRGRQGARELELRVDMKICARPGCDCTNVYLEIGRGGRPGSAHVIYDAASGAVARLHDPKRIAGNEGVLRERLGELRELFARRLARMRAQRDRHEWRGDDWQAHLAGTPVAFARVFPSAWNLGVVHTGRSWWVCDRYCVRPSCTCGATEPDRRVGPHGWCGSGKKYKHCHLGSDR
jgi:hypothetical protein